MPFLHRFAASVGALLFLSCASVGAIESVDEHARRGPVGDVVAPLDDALFGEQVSFFSGSTRFSVTDVALPGKGPPLAIGRTHLVGSKGGKFGEELDGPRAPGLFGEWDLDIPHLRGMFPMAHGWRVVGASPDARCSAPTSSATMRPPDQPHFYGDSLWGGHFLQLPGQGEQRVLLATTPLADRPNASAAYRWNTAGHWYFSCTPLKNGAGEGFVGHAPDGMRYYFDHLVHQRANAVLKWKLSAGAERVVGMLYPTRVEDRFGNVLDYVWSGERLLRIVGGGRAITLGYAAAGSGLSAGQKIATVSDGSQTWRYAYSPEGFLRTVTLPDGSAWDLQTAVPEFEITDGSTNAYPTLCHERWIYEPRTVTYRMTHPSGAVGEFQFLPMRHARARVAPRCDWDETRQEDRNRSAGKHFFAISLVRKTLSGPAMVDRAWTVTYSGDAGSWSDCTSCGATRTTEISASDGAFKRYYFSTHFGVSEGRLLELHEGREGQVLRKTWNHFDTPQQSPAPAYRRVLGIAGDYWGKDPNDEMQVPQFGGDTEQDGTTFHWRVAAGCNGTFCFDGFARPLAVRRTNGAGAPKDEATTYHDDRQRWVLGQVSRTTTDGIEVDRIEYDAASMPVRRSVFGKLQDTRTWKADGSLESLADGNGNTTRYSDWVLGVPRLVTYPDGGVRQSAVNADGTVSSVTDEQGNKTCFEYDAMRRLNRIVHPSETRKRECDTSAYAPTTIEFTKGHPAAYGIPAGHWRQTTRTGTARHSIVFDALWRPVVEQSVDLADFAGTASERVTRYDAGGRVAFRSQPFNSGGLATYSDGSLKGWHTTYDGLGRVVRVEQDSELGRLATTTHYLSNGQTRTTDARGQSTTTHHQFFGAPDYTKPTSILHPGGARTDIARDVFGKPTAITRSGDGIALTRRYVYDQYQQLCKTIEPETGATLMAYDGAGNLAWSSAGLSLLSPTSCDTTHPAAATRKVVRQYDARNRITALRFPDGRGDTTHAYTPQGFLHTLTAQNGNGETVTTSYAYNARGLPTSERLQAPALDWQLGSGYDANGHLAYHTYPGGLRVDYTPNALGQATQADIANNNPFAWGATYHPNGAVKRFVYGNGASHTTTLNVRGFPDRRRNAHTNDTVALLDESYDYDANGNVAAISDALPGQRGNRTMIYDARDRLTIAHSPMYGAAGARYAYDALDNLTRVIAPGRDQVYCYDAQNRLTNLKIGSCATGPSVAGMGYDAAGNLANRNGTTYDFDFGNRLRRIVPTAGADNTFAYDGHGRRVRASTTGDIFSMYDRDGVLRYQEDHRRGKRISYMHLAGTPVARWEIDMATGTAANRYLHTDALGSPLVVTNGPHGVMERTEYEPYGKVINRAGLDGVGYTGHVEDAATGWVYAQQRYFDPETARFPTVDPFGASLYDGSNFNRYWYANGNPYRYSDPDGRLPLETVWDAGNVLYDLGKVGVGLVTGNSAMVAEGLADALLDGAAMLTPYAPAGTQKLGRAAIKEGAEALTRKVPNPYGKMGGPRHQGKVSAVAEDVRSRGLAVKSEHQVKTPGGSKQTRYIDVAALDPVTGSAVELHQVGRSRIDGSPIAREQRAIDDVNVAKPEIPIFYHPYDK